VKAPEGAAGERGSPRAAPARNATTDHDAILPPVEALSAGTACGRWPRTATDYTRRKPVLAKTTETRSAESRPRTKGRTQGRQSGARRASCSLQHGQVEEPDSGAIEFPDTASSRDSPGTALSQWEQWR